VAGTASRRALGPWGGFLTGTAVLIEYAMAPAAIVVIIGGYIESLDLFGITSGWPVYLGFYAVFVGVHLLGVGEALKVTFVITAIAVIALLVFVVTMIPEFSTSNLTEIKPDTARAGASELLPFRLAGGGGADAIKDSDNPLLAAIDAAKGKGSAVGSFVNSVGLAGLVASFLSIIFAYSRQLFALSRSGYLPARCR